MEKIADVVMLPTTKPTPIIHIGLMKRLIFESNTSKYIGVLDKDESYQELYFLSDEKFQVGEWVSDGSVIMKAHSKLVNSQGLIDRREWKKVIATTDESLVIGGGTGRREDGISIPLPSVPLQFIDEFIYEYNKGKQIKKVIIEQEFNDRKIDIYSKPPFITMNGEVREVIKTLKINPNDNTVIVKTLPKEYILCAAIWYKEIPLKKVINGVLPKNCDRGLVVTGHRHGQCMWTMGCLTGLRSVTNAEDGVGDYEQGFLTNTNRFVDRKEGAQIAFEANQISEPKETLFSEDLY